MINFCYRDTFTYQENVTVIYFTQETSTLDKDTNLKNYIIQLFAIKTMFYIFNVYKHINYFKTGHTDDIYFQSAST